jgi:hypothetical protein
MSNLDTRILELFIWHCQLQDGIYPISLYDQKANIAKKISDHPDSLRIKRKFRKLWRKEACKAGFLYPLKMGPPTKKDMYERKLTVLSSYLKKFNRS